MQADDFIRKWSAGAPAHFIDLCRMLGVPEPGNIAGPGSDHGRPCR
jgi:hypothetical protein